MIQIESVNGFCSPLKIFLSLVYTSIMDLSNQIHRTPYIASKIWVCWSLKIHSNPSLISSSVLFFNLLKYMHLIINEMHPTILDQLNLYIEGIEYHRYIVWLNFV